MFSASKTGAGASGYQISNSLRFQSASSQYLVRTPASVTNRQTWTWSGWVKRGALNGAIQTFFRTDPTIITAFRLTASNTIEFFTFNGSSFTSLLITTQVFRDPSAWYHLVLAVDTTQATASNRIKMYVNGTQVTAFGTATYPTQNYNTGINENAGVLTGIGSTGGSEPFDGYMTEVNFIDGQALTPSSFGTTDATSGQWVAKKYTGTYGTNGFYLPFSNGTSTTTLGADSSGNGNNWTLTNFTRSAGASDCWMTDVPSGNSSTGGNYAVLNPLQIGVATLSAANQTVTISNASDQQTRSTIAIPAGSGAYYCEITITTVGGADPLVGIAKWDNAALSTYLGGNATTYGYARSGGKVNNTVGVAYGASWTAGDVIGIALDNVNGNLTFYKNGASQGVAYSSLQADMWMIALSGKGGFVASVNFGQRSFAYTPPSGFKALCTANLPVATIKQGSQQFNTVLYTGDGTNFTTLVTTGFAFGFSWIKNRSVAVSHNLYDVVRNASLESNTTGAEFGPLIVPSGTGFLPSSDSRVNQSGQAFVQWAWNAGSSTVTNTSGSISSQVRANPTAGFSIVTYTGTGANATVGHGLGVAPKMVIVKSRSGSGTSYQWFVWHTNIPNTNILVLNGTNGLIAATDAWNSTSPTSTTISLGTNTAVNGSTSTYVAYCFAEIAGFSKFGLYTGNGSADGPFVFLGFRPKFVMIKRTDSTSNWITLDSARNTYNEANTKLYLNSTSADDNGANAAEDFLSNGFKLRATWVDMNASGATYIYMAFAENPFAQSNAR